MDQFNDNDFDLIDGCRRNDRSAQELLYKKYFRKMYLMCQRYTTDDDVISAIINDAYLNVFKNIHKFEHRGSFEGWIRRITFNTLADHFRKEKRSIKFLMIEENDVLHFHDHSLENSQDYDDILMKINSLKGTCKDVFIKYAIEGYSHKEIGDKLQISEGTSKWYLSEARKKLQSLFYLTNNQFKYGR